MGNVSRPLIGLLVAVVAFFALWLVALKPSSSSTTGGPPHALGVYQSAINRAKGVQAVVNHGAAAAGGTATATAPAVTHKSAHKSAPASAVHTPVTASKAAPASKTHAAPKAAAHSKSPATPAQRRAVVERALASHKVLVALFYNPAASDDRAVEQELASVPTHSGKVVSLIVPLSELSNYTVITNQVPVAFSPTLVVINREGQASTIVGFADTFEIDQRIADAL